MTVYTFDQADGPLDSSWSVTGDTAATVNHEVVDTAAGTGSSTIVTSTGTVGDDQAITMTIGSIDLAKDDPGATGVGINARVLDTNLSSLYGLFIFGGSLSDPTWTWELSSLSGPFLQDATAPTPVEGMVIKFQVIGSSIKVYADDVIVHDHTDTDVTSGGYFGFTTSQGINIETFEITTSVTQTFTPPSFGRIPTTLPVGARGYDPIANALQRNFRARQEGTNVYSLSDGTMTETDPDNVNAFWQSYDGSPYVKRVFWGSTADPYELSSAEATALTDAGYILT